MASSNGGGEVSTAVSAEGEAEVTSPSVEAGAALGGLSSVVATGKGAGELLGTLISDERITVSVDGRDLLGPLVSDKRTKHRSL